MDEQQVWSAVLGELELNLSPGNFSTWISPLKAQKLLVPTEGKALLTVGSPSAFHKNYVADRFLGQIQQISQKALKKDCEIELTVVEMKKTTASSAALVKEDDLFSPAPKNFSRSLMPSLKRAARWF